MVFRFGIMRMLFVVFALLMLTVGSSAQGRGATLQIVVFNQNVMADQAVAALSNAHGVQFTHVYRNVLHGAAAIVPEGRLQALQNDPRVAYVEPDTWMTIQAQSTPTGIQRSFAAGNANLDIDGVDDVRVDVDVAVLDTGIDLEHPDLNVAGGIDCTLRSGGGPFATFYCGTGNGGDDDHYHGTHVAGTIGALDNGIGVVGVAPGARLWAVKVLNSQGSGYTSGIIAGIDWVVGQGNIEVINMSLGGEGVNTAYQDAIDNAVANGVVVVVAAGNSDSDANNYSPAFVPSAITVSALADFDGVAGGLGSPTCRTDQDDTLADFSNWGTAVDIAAPGVCILSTYPIEQGEYGTISGTSMAAPHVAGAAALLASGSNSPQSGADVQAIRDTLVNTGNYDWFDDSGDGVQEPLLDLSSTTTYNPAMVAGSDTGGGNAAPVASFTYSCTDLSCSFDGSGSTDSDGSISSYTWDFGDGATATGATASHTYAADGSYTVTLTVTDNEGATGSSSQTVTVSTATNEAPVASFTYSCTDLSCSFDGSGSTDSDGSISSYAWDFGDGATATGATASHTYAADGSYTVTLTVTDNEGATGSSSQTVTVSTATNEAPVASFTYSCTDLGCSFDGSGSTDSDGSISSYAWDFGDGATATGATASHTYAADGSYTVTLTVTDNEGATGSSSQTVTVSAGTASVIFVADLDGSTNNNGPNWSANVTITVRDDAGAAVSGAVVTGDFSTGDAVSCTTDANGVCTVTSSDIRKGGNNSMSFTVSGVSGDLPYDSASNTDPDGDSDGTTITIFR